MYQDKLLKSYLINYIKYIKEDKLEKDINHINNLRDQIGGFLKRCYNKYDGLEQIINSENRFNEKKYKKLCIQYGGETIEEKITRIINLGLVYKQLDNSKINENIAKITSSVDEVINKLKTILGTSVSPDKFIDDLESVLAEIKLAGDKYELNVRRNKIYLPESMPPPIQDTDIKSLDEIITKYINDVSGNMNSLKQDPQYSDKINALDSTLSTDLQKYSSIDLSSKITDIKSKNAELLQKINLINKSMETTDEDVSFRNVKMFKNIKSMDYLAKKYQSKPKVKELYDLLQSISKVSDFKEKNIRLQTFFKSNSSNQDLATTTLMPTDGIYPDFENIFTASVDSNIVISGATSANLNALKNILILDDADAKEDLDTVILPRIYKPDLEKYKPPKTTPITGGLLDTSQLVVTKSKNKENLVKFMKIINEYNTEFESYVSNIKKYNKLSYYSYIHTLFLGGIITNKIMEKGSKTYIYLNKGIIELFKRTLNEITPKIEDKNDDTSIIMYLRKYHYITIKTLNNFINKLSDNMTSRDIIDVKRCTGNALKKLILLNYFKDILSSYKSMFQNQVTIYARINDIRTKDKEGGQYGYEYEDAESKKTDIYDTNYFTSKMFASDYDRKNINKLVDDKKINNTTYDENILMNKDKSVNTQLMYVRPKACGIKPIDEDLIPNPNKEVKDGDKLIYRTKYQFTEVFDTDNFQDNEEISKSMLMDVQLGEKKGIAMLTYGYSGTGKTFTLFGSKSAGAAGILQATLKNIKGLSSLKFRLFELYGYGQVYPFYWTQGDDNDPKNPCVTGGGPQSKTTSHSITTSTSKLQTSTPTCEPPNKIKQAIKEKINSGMTYDKAEETVRNEHPDWNTNLDMIRHFIIEYNLSFDPTNGIIITEKNGKKVNVINAKGIADYTKKDPNSGSDSGFTEIVGSDIIEETLKSFDVFADAVETERVKGHKIPKFDGATKDDDFYTVKTVRDTPNNVASSRSVLVYDFRLEVGESKSPKEYVSFLIIDLPGKEEIIPSYVNPYFYDPIIQKIMSLKYSNKDIPYKSLQENAQKIKIDEKDEGLKNINKDFFNQIYFLKAMTASFGLNPMGLPLFGINTENNNADLSKFILDVVEEDSQKNYILNKKNKLAYYNTDKKELFDSTGVVFTSEHANLSTGTVSNWLESGSLTPKNANQNLYGELQGKCVASVHMINRLALVGRFDLIEKIYQKFADYYINFFKIEQKSQNSQISYVIKYGSNELNIEDFEVDYVRKLKGSLIVELLKNNGLGQKTGFKTFAELYTDMNKDTMIKIYTKLFGYDYFLPPLEGIYINENIVGLIKFLADTLTVTNPKIDNIPKLVDSETMSTREFNLRQITPLQDKSLSFIKKQQESRYKLSGSGNEKYDLSTNTAVYYPESVSEAPFFKNATTYDYSAIIDTYKKSLETTYKSNNIYNFNKPIITDILKPYLENKDATEAENRDRIKDFKVFYLFGNYTDNNLRRLKCVQQVDLLSNTTKFIDMVAGQKK
jgi:hypothetical protein